MNKISPILILVIFHFYFQNLNSQELWGITNEGGSNNNGTIFKIDIPSGNHTVEYDYPYAVGLSPKNLIESNDGYVYGSTSGYNTGIDGNIIRFNPVTNVYESIFQFSDSLGRYPAGILQDSITGIIYGINTYGGQYDNGNIFKFNPFTNDYSVLFNFDYTLGAEPMGSIIHLNDSLIYGVTKVGGNLTRGVLYSFNISSNTYSVLFNFSDSLGSSLKSIILASNGNIYGTTYYGGEYYEGVLFKYDIESGSYFKLIDFNESIGKSIKGSLIEASNGKLYGSAYGGGEYNGGVLFEYDTQSELYSVKYNFEYHNGHPKWFLSELNEGEIFGGTNNGGYYHCGMIFKLDILNDSLTFISDLDINKGSRPSGLFFKCSNGKIISTTEAGGTFNFGTLFEFDISDYSISKIHDFYAYTEYHNTLGTLLNSPEGKIYGLTRFMRNSSLDTEGTFFSIDKVTKEYNVLDVFSRPANSLSTYNYNYYIYPRHGLSELYFRGYYPDSLMSYSLFEFSNPLGSPSGELVLADDKKLYGLQTRSSPNPTGLTYSINPLNFENEYGSWFWGSNGAYPTNNSLVNIGDGYLYGLTAKGGDHNSGVIFKYDTEIDEIIKLYDFHNSTGGEPTGKLLYVENGILYGTTRIGGENDQGILYKYSLFENEYEVIYNFSSENGANPSGSLLKASNGKFYGMTTNGGDYDMGVVFEFDIETNIYNKIFDFDLENGGHPFETSLIEACNIPSIISQPESIDVIYGDSTMLTFVYSEGDALAFQWYFQNMLLEGATNDTLVINNASIFDQGYYFCRIITPCGSIFTNTVKVSLVNGINTNIYSEPIKVYPNPVIDNVNLEFTNQQSNVRIKVVDIYGNQLIEKLFRNIKKANLKVDVLKNGVYILHITISGNEKYIKIIKK